MIELNPRVVTELHGNLPENFFNIFEDVIFYREYYTEHGMAVWVPKSSIMECQDPDVLVTPLYLSLHSAFEKHPEFDSITLSNT
jgi:hypothetical protein